MSTQVHESELFETEAKSFRKSKAPLVIAVAANLLVSALLLGLPYYRGREHAEASLNAFSRFSACLLGGEVVKSPGLSLPRGDRERFAQQLLTEGATWPGRCQEQLAAIAPPDVTFVWPSVKRTGGDVRKVVDMLDGELSELRDVYAERDAIPERPLLVLAKLRAALALFAKATSQDVGLDRDAITFDNAGKQEDPTRLPLMAGQTAVTQAFLHDGNLQAVAADSRGVSWMRLADGKLERRRPRRTGIVRGTLVANDEPYLVWATREARCAELEDQCAGRAFGVRPYDTRSDTLPEPIWYRGHPAARIDRALRVRRDGITLLARAPGTGGLEVRRFTAVDKQEEQTVTAPDATTPLPTRGQVLDALLLPKDEGALVIEADGEARTPRWYGPNTVKELAPIAGEDVWSQSCATGDYVAFAYGSTEQLLVSVGRDGEVSHSAPVKTLLHAPYDDADPRKDTAHLRCGPDGPMLTFIDRQHQLWALRCDLRGHCEAPERLAKKATLQDSMLVDDRLVVAYSSGRFGQIRIQADGKTLTPGPCFTPRMGLCGQPILLGHHDRVVLLAHEGSDLLAMESRDQAASFVPLAGLTHADQGLSNQRALKQHRLRKGLD